MTSTEKVYVRLGIRKASPCLNLEANETASVVATFEIHSLGQSPYFAATCTKRDRNGREFSWGADHDTINEWFPELAKFTRWHLTSFEQPMHYEANALFHAGIGRYSERNAANFASTIVYGALEGETLTADELLASLESMVQKDEVEAAELDLRWEDASAIRARPFVAFLRPRLPLLMRQFRADMAELFLEVLPKMDAKGMIDAKAFLELTK